MKIILDGSLIRLRANAQAIRALIEPLSIEQASWKPDSDTWSMNQVMEHVLNEERLDLRPRLQEIFSNPPKSWGAMQGEYIPTQDCQPALKDFLTEREASLMWLQGLKSPDWNLTNEATFGPNHEIMVLSAGDILTSWVEHDFLHLRQMIELLHAWNVEQADPYSVAYAGGW